MYVFYKFNLDKFSPISPIPENTPQILDLGNDFRDYGNDFRGFETVFRGYGNNFRGLGNHFRGLGNQFRGYGNHFRGLGNQFRGYGNHFRNQEFLSPKPLFLAYKLSFLLKMPKYSFYGDLTHTIIVYSVFRFSDGFNNIHD